MDPAFSLHSGELAPLTEWLDEVRRHVDRLSRQGWDGIKRVSADEWERLHGAVSGAVSAERVQGVLSEFLARVGLRGGTTAEELARREVAELRARIVCFRAGLTIEDYGEYLAPPPRIDL